MQTKRAYKFRFYPDQQQEKLLTQTFGCVRYVYNSILRYRTDAYDQTQEKIGYMGANARLTAIKKLPESLFLNEVSSVPLQQCLRSQQTAFKNFFEGRAKYPVFKSKKHRQSAEFTYRAFTFKNGELKLAKCEQPLAIKWSQTLPSDPTTITVSKDQAGRYFVSCLCEFDATLLPITDNKAKRKVARIHAKIADCRSDNLHKLSRKLIN
ncbi:MAG: transposase, partial [Thiothrix lacustris]